MKTDYSFRAVTLLCCMDAFERIDTLMLEIRHIQETVASQLRIHQFYAVFRYEDNYLWGRFSEPPKETPSAKDASTTAEPKEGSPQDWAKALTELQSVSQGCDALARL